MESRTTIKDVAAALGLSICTVNRALTGKPHVTPETRQRVEEAAARLGYRPNLLAQSMGRPLRRIGAIYPDIWPSHCAALFRGVRERLGELRDFRVESIFRTIPAAGLAGFRETVRETLLDRIDGLVVSITDREQAAELRELTGPSLPLVVLGSVLDDDLASGLCCVWHDCRTCGVLAGEMLAFALPPNAATAIFIGWRQHPDHRGKIAGMTAELRRRGLPPPIVVETFDAPERAFPAAQRLFTEHPELNGIFIGTENAAGILEFLEQSGRASRVRVVATGASEPVTRRLETGLVGGIVHQRQHFQGRLAVDTLFRMLDGNAPPTPVINVAPQLLLRGNYRDF